MVKRWKRISWGLCVSVILAGVLISCTFKGQGVYEIRIGVIASMSGELANYGQETRRAAELAIEEIKSHGGLVLDGQPHEVVLFFEDDQDNPEISVRAAVKLMSQDKIVALVGPHLSRNAIPVANVAEQVRVPMISPVSTNPETTRNKDYVFRVGFVDPFQGAVLARFARTELHAQHAAVLYDIASAYNRDLAEFFRAGFEQEGGKVVAFTSYTTGEQHFRKQLNLIRDSEADVLFLPNYKNEVQLQAQQARELGIAATLLGSDSWAVLEDSNLDVLNGSFFSAQFAEDVDQERVRAFITLYRQRYGQMPNDVTALTYDAFGLLFAAIQHQGKADSDSIQRGLRKVYNYPGLSGSISYEQSGDPVKSVFIMQIQHGSISYYTTAQP